MNILKRREGIMKGRKTRWAVLAAMALVGGMASNALGIEAFQERFEWGDLSKPTTLHGPGCRGRSL